MSDRLWAPWRLDYIENASSVGAGSKTGRSIFLELPEEGEDRKNFILYRGVKCFVMLNAFPYASGHMMVAPYLETSEILEMDDETLLEINQVLGKAVSWLRAAYNPQGFNIGVNLGSAAGAGIPTHLHWHVVPRWSGDANYMTVIGETRVIPQSLEASYDRLKAVIDV